MEICTSITSIEKDHHNHRRSSIMKVRLGFVANSSSSSFILFAAFDDNNLKGVLNDAQRTIISDIEKATSKLKVFEEVNNIGVNKINQIKEIIDKCDIPNDNNTSTINLSIVSDIYSKVKKVANDKELYEQILSCYIEEDANITDNPKMKKEDAIQMYQKDIDEVYEYIIQEMRKKKVNYPIYLYSESADIGYYDEYNMKDSDIVIYCNNKSIINIYLDMGI